MIPNNPAFNHPDIEIILNSERNALWHVTAVVDGSFGVTSGIGASAAEIRWHKQGDSPSHDIVYTLDAAHLSARSSLHMEIAAIHMALLNIKKIKNKMPSKIASIQVHTDSLRAKHMLTYARAKITSNELTINELHELHPSCRRVIRELAMLEDSMRSKFSCSLSIHKVKGHKDPLYANRIESIHNSVDAIASLKRSQSERIYLSDYTRLLKSNPETSMKSCGIITPFAISSLEFVEYKMLGLLLAKEGYHIRVTSENPNDTIHSNPVVAGIKQYHRLVGSTREEFEFFQNESAKNEGGTFPGIMPANRIYRIKEYIARVSPERFRRLFDDMQLTVGDLHENNRMLSADPLSVPWQRLSFNDRASLNAELATFVHYGGMIRGIQTGYWERNGSPSAFIVNKNRERIIKNPRSISEWSSFIHEFNQAPQITKSQIFNMLNAPIIDQDMRNRAHGMVRTLTEQHSELLTSTRINQNNSHININHAIFDTIQEYQALGADGARALFSSIVENFYLETIGFGRVTREALPNMKTPSLSDANTIPANRELTSRPR